MEGDYAYKYVVTTANTEDSYVYQDLVNPTLYQSREIIVGIWIKTGTLGSGYAPNLYINDGVGTTSGTAITASDTDWTFTSVTRTISGSASRIRIIIGDDDAASGSTACTFYFDAISMQVEGSGAEECVGLAEHNDIIYEIPVTNKDETERQELFLEQIEIMEDIINLQ